MLFSGFFGRDSTARWLSCIALSHGVAGNSQQKEQLLRVQVTTGVGNPSISLLQQCSNTLITSSTQGKFVVNLSIYFTLFNFVLCFFWCFCVCFFLLIFWGSIFINCTPNSTLKSIVQSFASFQPLIKPKQTISY